MPLGAAALGLIVGFLTGLTGMGGGAMMTPLLLWTGWVAPTVAVGTHSWTTQFRASSAGRKRRPPLRMPLAQPILQFYSALRFLVPVFHDHGRIQR
jgi:uncharacterized membrane protein YfcA